MRLRLYHHSDGARIAYRETGTGPVLVLLHSLGLSHRVSSEGLLEMLAPACHVLGVPLHGVGNQLAKE